MALKLFVKLQTPTIELKVSAKDASGNKDSLLVGFKRYELDAAQAKMETVSKILKTDEKDEQGNPVAPDSKEVNDFLKGEIVYLKQLKLDLVDDAGNTKELAIADTRTVKPNEGLWESADECLAVLLDMYLSSAPYRLSLITSMYKALFNGDYSDAEAKN